MRSQSTPEHTEKSPSKSGYTYVMTWLPEDPLKDTGHTSCYTVSEDAKKALSLSVFPSTFYNQHRLSALKLPVACFNTKGPLSDIRYENRAPDSIRLIKGTDFEAMEKHHNEFLDSIKSKHTLFALNYKSLNPLNLAGRFLHAHRNLTEFQAKDFDGSRTPFPSCDDSFVADKKPEHKPFKLVNCTESGRDFLNAGGVKTSKKGFFSKQPADLLAELAGQSEEVINQPDKLPPVLREAVNRGTELSRKAQKEKENQKEKIDNTPW